MRVTDPKFHEKDFWPTSIKEIEHVRSPFYELSKINMFRDDEEVHKELETLGLKMGMIEDVK